MQNDCVWVFAARLCLTKTLLFALIYQPDCYPAKTFWFHRSLSEIQFNKEKHTTMRRIHVEFTHKFEMSLFLAFLRRPDANSNRCQSVAIVFTHWQCIHDLNGCAMGINNDKVDIANRNQSQAESIKTPFECITSENRQFMSVLFINTYP